MHDLDPQDHPRHRAREEETDLSLLDGDALAIEARREALRDQRQERHAREDRARQDRRKAMLEGRVRVALLCLLIFAAVGSLTVAVIGLLEGNTEIVSSGLISLCAICGGTIYRLRGTER